LYCLGIGVGLLIIPWMFILHWILRIAVWVFLGPWMMIVDKYLNQQSDTQGETTILENFAKQRNLARLKGEENLKRKALRSLLYGNYSVNVPSRNISLHYDLPLSESTATKAQNLEDCNVNTVVPGQYLDGSMILRRYSNEKEVLNEKSELEKSNFKLSALQRIAANKDAIEFNGTTISNPTKHNARKKKKISQVIKEDEIYEDGIEVYGTICSASSMDKNFKWGVDMIQYGSELEVVPRNDVPLTSNNSPTSVVENPAQDIFRYNEVESKQYNHRVIQSAPSWVTTSTYHDARDEDEIEEQGLEIISYHQLSDNNDTQYYSNANDNDSLEGKNIINRTPSDVSSLTCLYHSSPDVDIAFYKKNK